MEQTSESGIFRIVGFELRLGQVHVLATELHLSLVELDPGEHGWVSSARRGSWQRGAGCERSLRRVESEALAAFKVRLLKVF